MINLYLNEYSTLYEVPDYFTITQVDKYVDVTIRVQNQDIYSTTLYEDGSGKAYFYGFRQLLAQNMEGRYLTLASLAVYAAHEDGMESYEDKYILFSKVFFYEEQGDFMKNIFLNTRSYYVVPRSEYMPLSLFMDGSEVPGLSGTAVFKMEDGRIYTYDFTRTTYNYNLPHIYYFYLCADAIQRQIEQAEGADSGELGTLVSFSVRAGKRSVTIYVTDEEPAIYFDFRNAFNVDERIFIYGSMKLKTSFDRKEASLGGNTTFYNMSEERKYEVETVPMTMEEAEWFNEFLGSHYVERELNQDWQPTVLISDISSEISDSAKDLIKMKFSWRYQINARWINTDRYPQQFTAPFNDTFK